MQYLLGPRKTLIVRGPASIALLTGKATALCAPLENRPVTVQSEKQLPIETSAEAFLNVLLGKSGGVYEVDGSTIPSSWDSALETLVEMEQGKVVIVGATDVGKSTLSTFLANGLLRNKISSRIVDADIGQADIGPPTTIGSSNPHAYISSLGDLKPSALIFVGHTSPSRVQSKLLASIRRILNDDQHLLTIINTDGWVLDPQAVTYKTELIEAIQPDLVLGIAISGELESIISKTSVASMRIKAPAAALSRSASDRREIRKIAYRRFLDEGRVRGYSVREIKLKLPPDLTPIQFARTSGLSNLLVGLVDDRGFLLQIGVLLSLEKELVRVYSRPTDPFEEIEVGYVRLSTDGVELGYLEY
jgi:polynucleotide 5'-hydroxyl-kinase GRC3/NOL9